VRFVAARVWSGAIHAEAPWPVGCRAGDYSRCGDAS
jgi:hypothetical protein